MGLIFKLIDDRDDRTHRHQRFAARYDDGTAAGELAVSWCRTFPRPAGVEAAAEWKFKQVSHDGAREREFGWPLAGDMQLDEAVEAAQLFAAKRAFYEGDPGLGEYEWRDIPDAAPREEPPGYAVVAVIKLPKCSTEQQAQHIKKMLREASSDMELTGGLHDNCPDWCDRPAADEVFRVVRHDELPQLPARAGKPWPGSGKGAFKRQMVGTCERNGCYVGSIDDLHYHEGTRQEVCEACWNEIEAGQ